MRPRLFNRSISPALRGGEITLELSVVVPVYNEVESLEALHAEITANSALAVKTYEVIYVDDGSSDGSADKLDTIADGDERVTVIHLRRNFGKSPALAAGFEHIRG